MGREKYLLNIVWKHMDVRIISFPRMVTLLIMLLISNAITLSRDKSIFPLIMLFISNVINFIRKSNCSLIILYNQLSQGNNTLRCTLLTAKFFTNFLHHLNRVYTGLEWAVNTPPKPHSFVSLPLQSNIMFRYEFHKNNFIFSNSISLLELTGKVYKFSTGSIVYSDVDVGAENGSSSDHSDDQNDNVNPNDGRELDRTQAIANKYFEDKTGLGQYFSDKERAIYDAYREDSNSAAISGVQASELNDWLDQRDSLLEELKGQINDVNDTLIDMGDSTIASNEVTAESSDNKTVEQSSNSGSLVGDFADTSQEMPSYMDPED